MVNDDDIVELLVDSIKENSWKEAVAAGAAGGKGTAPATLAYKQGFFLRKKFIKSSTTLPKGRRFFTEYEIKQMIKGGVREITIPRNAIISPLAQEIINEKGIKVERR